MGSKYNSMIDLDDIKSTYRKFVSNKIEYSNIIIDLLKLLETTDHVSLKKAISLSQKMFSKLIEDGDIIDICKIGKENPRAQYTKWLNECYTDVLERFKSVISTQKYPMPVKELAFMSIIRLVQKESQHGVNPNKYFNIPFPLHRLVGVYESILSANFNLEVFIRKLKKYFEAIDFTCISLAALSSVISKYRKQPLSSTFTENLIIIMELIRLYASDNSLPETRLFEDAKSAISFVYSYKEARAHYNVIWEEILRMEFSPWLYRRCLVLIPERVLAHLHQPLKLTDYFINAYNVGGVISLLAMKGVYLLVTQYNLEYPDFYSKVYVMLDSPIFHAKYKARFFILVNKFLQSPYLPEYIVAAFVKKSCRLMLTAPSCSLVLLLKFVANLLIRYPSLRKLIHKPEIQTLERDPFEPKEPNPKLCRAGESSLWEIATLREHPLCGVSKAANFIYKNLPDFEHSISRFTESTYEEMYNKSAKIRQPQVAATFHKPQGLFNYSDDAMSETWKLF